MLGGRFQSIEAFARWLGERAEDDGHVFHTGQPLVEPVALIDHWLHQEVSLHFQVGLAPTGELADVEVCELCADLQYRRGSVASLPGYDAIAYLDDFYSATEGEGQDWLDRPVLVEARHAIKNAEGMILSHSLAALVRLVPTHDCDICAAYSRQSRTLSAQGVVEILPCERDREVDTRLLPIRKRRDWSPTTLNERPRKVIKTTSVVLDDIAKSQTPPFRKFSFRGTEGDRKPVVLRLILAPGETEILALEIAEGVDVSLQSLRFDYRPAPFEPRAVKGISHAR